MKKNRLIKQAATMLLAFILVFTMMPMLAAETVHAATANGGIVASDNTVRETEDEYGPATISAQSAFGEGNVSSEYDSAAHELRITLLQDITLSSPVRFVKGNKDDSIVLDLSGHSITGRAGVFGSEYDAAMGSNAIEIAADEFNVEITGSGTITGGKGSQYTNGGIRKGARGGDAVYFCERVDNLHGITEQWGDVLDEGYRPDRLEYGLTLTGGAELIGGSGADASYDDWLSNIGEDDFSAEAGDGGAGIGQVFTGTDSSTVLEELSYARIVISEGKVRGGAGGNMNLGDHLFTRHELQKLDAIRAFMRGKDANGYAFDDHITDEISFSPGNGGSGIEFYAGRKYVSVEAQGKVYGGSGGKTTCSERAAMAKSFETECGEGGIGIHVCGDTGLTRKKAALSDTSADADYWGNKNKDSDDVGIYISGQVKGGSSPETDLLYDASAFGGTGIDCELDSRYLSSSYTGAMFDSDRGIVLVDEGGKVCGGDGSTPDSATINGGSGGDGIKGGATGGINSSHRMTASDFVIRGEVSGGYGSYLGGAGVILSKEREDTSSGNSEYYAGIICGNGTIKGGDSGEWPSIGEYGTYRAESGGTVYYADSNKPVCVSGIHDKYENHPGSLTISSTINESTGAPAHLMPRNNSFKVLAEMTPFTTAPGASTKLRATVTKPSGYSGRVYIKWKAYFNGDPEVYDVEGANGSYNNFNLLGDADYSYGIKTVSYGKDYKISIATYDRMAEQIKYNNSGLVTIYCMATLEDGRRVQSNEIWFRKDNRSSTGWIGGSGGTDAPSAADRSAAANVQSRIDKLADPESIDLSNEEEIEAIRAEYEALTAAQKELVDISRLEAAETKINQINEEAAGNVIALIENLPSSEDFAVLTDEADIAAAKAAIEDAINAYNYLTDRQKDLVDDSGSTYYLNEVKRDFNDTFPESSIEADIVPADHTIRADQVTLSGSKYTFTGKAIKPAVTVKVGTRTLRAGVDYKLVYSGNINAGTGHAKVSPAEGSRYTGTVDKKFTILPKSIKPAVTLKAKSFNYTGKVIAPKVKTVKDGNKSIGAAYYKVSYKGARKAVGTYSVIVTMKGNYKGSKTVKFTIGPKAVTISKPKAAKKALTVKWKAQKAKMPKKRVTGYQVQVSTVKNFSKGVKTKNVKGYKKTSVKVKGLKARKTYYIRVRTYMKVSGKTYYSTWSAVKSAKTK